MDYSIVNNQSVLIYLVKCDKDKYLFMKQVFFFDVFRGYIGLPERLGVEKMRLKNRNR